MWLGPDQSQQGLNFGEVPDHIQDAKTFLLYSKVPFAMHLSDISFSVDNALKVLY